MVSPFLRSFLLQRPIYCTWQVTNRCNFRCEFCNIWKINTGHHGELTLNEFTAAARKLRQCGPMLVSLAGGEPFLRKDLVNIVARISQHHIPLLTTNGWFVTRGIARQLFRAGLMGISVSIDYADSELHDRRRGMKGAHHRALQALRTLVEEKRYEYQEVNLLCVLLHDNLDQLEHLIDLAASLGATFKIQPYSHMRTGDSSFIAGNRAVQHLLDLRARCSSFLSSREYLESFDLYLAQRGIPDCRAGKSYLNIDSCGRVSKCVDSREYVGNIRNMSTPEMVKRLRFEHAANSCTSCWYICRGEIDRLYSAPGVRAVGSTALRIFMSTVFSPLARMARVEQQN